MAGAASPSAIPTRPPTIPARSKIAGALAALACVAGCALPFLIGAGVLTGAAAAVLRSTLLVAAAGLVVAALGMWWLHRRRAGG